MKTRGKRIALLTACAAIVVLGLATYFDWPHLVFWYRFEPLGVNQFGLREYRHRKTGIVMVKLPGGKFWMGAQKEDPNGQNYDPEAEDDEGPVHAVTLSPFLIGKFEVTQGQWKKVSGSNPSDFTDENRPVENVSWEDIQKFEAKTWLGLPSEAQWEYACRAKTTGPFAGKLEDLGWFHENSEGPTQPVGTRAANGFGLHDVHGNVFEWCEDVYDESFYGKREAAGPDPVSGTGSGLRIVRGGCWVGGAGDCRSARRERTRLSVRVGSLGFRAAYYPLP